MQQHALNQPGGDPMGDVYPMSLEELDYYFDNLASEATNDKLVLENLVANLVTLTTSNVEMVNMIKKLSGENQQLKKQINCF